MELGLNAPPEIAGGVVMEIPEYVLDICDLRSFDKKIAID